MKWGGDARNTETSRDPKVAIQPGGEGGVLCLQCCLLMLFVYDGGYFHKSKWWGSFSQ
jgi:hypothetical protein